MRLKYRPEIDGLRAVAVIPVIFFHAGFELFSGGYTGVDVFFVISGYLITSIIYSELKENNFSIINFYERRARRILPLLFCVLLVSIPFAWISLFPTDNIDFFESLIAVPAFGSNFLFVSEANYFDTAVELKPLLHTWSLAVEEQFYIFFPLIMLLFFKLLGKNRILPFIALAFIVSFILAEWASIRHPTHNFFLLPTRGWELGVGSILGILITDQNSFFLRLKKQPKINEIVSIIGLTLILLGFFVIDNNTPFPSSWALFPVIGTAIIIAFTDKNTLAGRILSSKPFIFIGLISYSAYLWHHPLIAFAKHLSFTEQSFVEKTVLCLAVIPLSYLSWRFVENPFRNKKKFKRKFIFTFSLIGSIFFILVGFWGVSNDGFPNRSITKRLEVRGYSPDNRILLEESWSELRKAENELENHSWFKDENSLPNMLVVGNSHSKDIYNVLMNSEIATKNFEIGRVGLQIAHLSNLDHEFFFSLSYKNADIIVVASRYNYTDFPHFQKVIKRFVNDHKRIVIVKDIHNFKVINAKTKADILVEEYIRGDYNLEDNSVVDELVKKINKTYFDDYMSGTSDRILKSDNKIDSIKSAYPDIIVLDRMKYVCTDTLNTCFAINSKLEKYYYDYGHHTREGAMFYGHRIDEIKWLEPLLNASQNNY